MALWLGVGTIAMAQSIQGREGIKLPAPPAVEATPVADDYFGTKIPDSYRCSRMQKAPRRGPSSMPRTPTPAVT